MKSLLLVAIIFASFAGVSAQTLGEDVCVDKKLVGVEIRPQGFQNNVEAEMLTVAILNLDLRDPSAGYCLTAAAGTSERKLMTRSSMRVLGRERTQDALKPMLIRSGIRIGVGEILRRVPYGMRSTIRQTSRQYTQEPRITIYQVQVTSESWMTGPGGIVVWKGLGSRIFTVRETYYPGGYGQKKVEIIGGGDPNELIPYGDAVRRPETTNAGNRVEQLMRLLVMRDSMLRENHQEGGQQLIARQQPQEVR